MTIPLLVLVDLAPAHAAHIESAGFLLHHAPTAAERARFLASPNDQIRAVLTNGSTGLTAEEITRLPQLEIICAQGAGYEKIDVTAARARGVVVTHGPGTNGSSVADHAMTLLMSIARGIPQADAAVRRGEWACSRQPRPMISGKRLGILGLGTIGAQIARRGASGFDMPIAYHNRRPRDGSPYLYHPTPAALADWCDFLVIATPGGAGTFHLVDGPVLEALGPNGFLINIARGSVVDTAVLIEALQNRWIAGAALDVVEGEPEIPAELTGLSNVILTPHIAGRSPEAVMATVQLVCDNLCAHFSGHPVKTPVP
ncbi:2-hydroxyacid dehydrogenase [Telmatospirillum sp.]|uniref:2-hydroxyacid dehydrogenase n=1 Tax=Telmatospirillum sp. TaxID=2079197 RepID=UPI00283EB976|nr:2-hydroxyacid dehydrogenase [Telmatospirillum sp.]MDR3435665.1 2-hydroxyacid dehydrogenase [Telmatospirillum sp.]